MIFILFGPPGVGKTTLGNMLGKHFSIPFFDADSDLTDEEKSAIKNGLWNNANRITVIDRLTVKAQELDSDKHLIISVALTKQWMRDRLIDKRGVIKLVFILVESNLSEGKISSLVEQRCKEGHPITVEQFKRFTKEFELPSMEHFTITNSHGIEGNKHVCACFDSILNSLLN